ncbi:glycoside hydrolase family 108 protein [Ekhidna sp.]
MIYSLAYDNAFEYTIGHEGKYVNDPDDPGGETKFGVSKRSYAHLDIKNLTIEDAKKIYFEDFWLKLSCDKMLPDAAKELFDTSINMGTIRGAKIFQEALNLTNRDQRDYKNISIDGNIGPATLKAFESNKYKKALVNVMNILQGEFYINLMRKKERNEKYIGWFNRIEIRK